MPNFKSLINTYVHSWKHHTAVQLATLTVLTATFTLIIFSLSISDRLDNILYSWGKSIKVSVFLDDDLDNSEINLIQNTIKSDQVVDTLKVISKNEAKTQFQKSLSTYAPDLANDDFFSDIFPASLEITLKKTASYSVLPALSDSIKKLSGVNEVLYGQDWVQNYAGFVDNLRQGAWITIMILIFGSFFVIGNAIRLSISQKREEIEVLELIGATKGFVRSPYIFEGILTGLISTFFAIVVAIVFSSIEYNLVFSKIKLIQLSNTSSYFTFYRCLLFCICGATIGALGSFICVSRINDGWAATQGKK